ncbi:hypothetical protein PCC7424_2523 [Gloeothece citriformis PCC 7424]|uniref:eCIS core domain-containing protein n=1 Tax=Gloeothece citriformis (strain PCC 7424) TaxID=65393 RepID=B7KK55_GLOC7|nr:DUF4157 domain-containing protein [Gloeothece citriformis]ACK70940.1 hypothetical protein PCC7424_2523 [Gloeothece citriformis PCC 7424]
MSESASKTKISSWQPTTTHQSDSHLTPRSFPLPVNNAPQVQASQDLEGYRKPQSGDMIENVRRSQGDPRSGAQETAASSAPTEPTATTENFLIAPPPSTFGLNIQPKLTIGEPGDKYEQEADKVASEVVQRINTPPSVQRRELRTPSISTLSSQPGGYGEIKLKPLIQRQDELGGGEATQELESSINSARGGGQPLDVGLQRSMGEAMGADFSGVRVHTDAQADQLNRSIQARAFTTGQDVFFRQGEYNPGSRGGQELIAHELTHVVQQHENHLSKSSLPHTFYVSSIFEPTIQGVFSNAASLSSHFNKHVITQKDAGGTYANEAAYEAAADAIVADPTSLSKPRAAGGSYYFKAATGQFVATNAAGEVLTMFVPSSGQAYYNKQK